MGTSLTFLENRANRKTARGEGEGAQQSLRAARDLNKVFLGLAGKFSCPILLPPFSCHQSSCPVFAVVRRMVIPARR